jgi:hypothetical protein
MFNYLKVTIFAFVLLTLSAKAEQKDLLTKDKKLLYEAYDPQDRYHPSRNTSLKGFKTFIVLISLHEVSKALSDQINQLVQKNVKKYGTVNIKSLLTEKGIDLSGLSAGPTLMYAIRNLTSPDGKNLGITRASLNLSTSATITKTHETDLFYTWAANCFLSGSVEKNTEKIVLESLNVLFKTFQTCYSSVNSEKPIFNLYLQ